jgi:ABC-type antimicrobial peptide transport system permease subunit
MHSDHISAAPLIAPPSSHWWQLWPLLQLSFWQGLRELLRKPTQSVPFVLSLALMLAMFVTLICISRTLWLQPIAGVKDIAQIQAIGFDMDIGGTKMNFFDVKMFPTLQQSLAGAGQFSLLSFNQPAVKLAATQLKPTLIVADHQAADMLGLKLLSGSRPAESTGTSQVWISEALWRSFFAASADVQGQSLEIAGQHFSIAGVVEHFAGHSSSALTQPNQIWQFVPDTALASQLTGNQTTILLYRQTSSQQLQPQDLQAWYQAQLDQQGLHANHPHRQLSITQQPYLQLILGQSGVLALMLLAVSMLLLAITVLNLANLTAGRFTSRQRDMALQLVAGCSLGRLRVLIFTELLAWTLPAFILALLAAAWLLRLLPEITGGLFPLVSQMQLSLNDILLLLLVVLLLTTALSLPLLTRHFASNLQTTLAASGKGLPAQRGLARSWLLLQVLLSTTVVLTAACLTLSSYRHIFTELGYRLQPASHLTVQRASTDNQDQVDPASKAQQDNANFLRWQSLQQLISAQLPEYQVLLAEGLPIQSRFNMLMLKKQGSDQVGMVLTQQTDADYQSAFEMPLLHGRYLQPADLASGGPTPVLINQFYAKQLAGNDWTQAVGMTLLQEEKQFQVVGIVQDVKSYLVLPAFYRLPQQDMKAGLVLRHRDGDSVLTPQQQQQVKQLLQQAGLTEELEWTSLMDIFQLHSRQARLNFYLIALLAATSLLLAVLGVAGIGRLYSHQRRYELAVRLATGASQRQLYLLMLKPLLPLLALAVALALLISHQVLAKLWPYFPQLKQLELPMQLLLALLMWLVAALAGWWPVRQTLRQDPLQTLRSL